MVISMFEITSCVTYTQLRAPTLAEWSDVMGPTILGWAACMLLFIGAHVAQARRRELRHDARQAQRDAAFDRIAARTDDPAERTLDG